MNNGGGGVAELTEALATLADAQQAVDDFVEENGDVRVARDEAVDTLNAHLADENGVQPSDAQLQAAVATAEADLTDAQDAVDTVEGLGSAINALNAAQAEYVAAVETGEEAQISFTAELARLQARYDVTPELFPNSEDLGWEGLADVAVGTVVLGQEEGGESIIVMGENGQLELAEATADFDPAELVGIDELLAVAQQTFDAAVIYANAREAFETAIENVVLVDNPEFDEDSFNGDLNDFYNEFTGELESGTFELAQATAYSALLEAEAALASAEQAVEERAELRQDVAEAQAAVVELEALEATRNEALARLEDAEEDGGLGVSLVSFENGSATADSDLYVFADAKGETISITNFGAEGEDRIFFGDGYNFVQLEEDQTINNRVGSADELEIFWEETSSGLTLYVEAGAEAGRDLNTAEITTIELAGVSADDASFAGGFVTVA